MEKKKVSRHKIQEPIPKGDIHFEIDFYEKLLKKDPDIIEALMALAHDYTLVGRFEDGLRTDHRLAQLLPNEPVVRYNLACSLSLTNHITEAGEALVKAIELGYADLESIEKDPDLANLRSHPLFDEIKQKQFKHQN